MKNLLLIIVSILYSNSLMAGCTNDHDDMYVFGTEDIINFPDIINGIAANQGCNYSYVGSPSNGGFIGIPHYTMVNMVTSSTMITNFFPDFMQPYTFSLFNNNVVNLSDVLDQMYLDPNYNQPGGVLSWNNGNYFDVVVRYMMTASAVYVFKLRIYHAFKAVPVNMSLCYDKDYSINTLFPNLPVEHLNRTLTSNYGDVSQGSIINISQQPYNFVTLTYSALVWGHLVKREWSFQINTSKEAYFTNTAHASGAITANSPPTNMQDYVFSAGGTLEYMGNGLIQNGPNWFFDPSIASPENNLMLVRSNYFGCLSDWRDTVFYVTPIVSVVNAPAIDLEYTFGPNNSGTYVFSNIYGSFMYEAMYHAGCSNTNYTFAVDNPQAGLTYEWKAIFNYSQYLTGFGNTFSILMPDRNSIDLNVTSSNYSADTIFNNLWNQQYAYSGVIGATVDLDNNTVDGTFTSVHLGDNFEIYLRAININGDVSPWNKTIIGLVPLVENSSSSLLCFDGNPQLNPQTQTPIYNDSLDYSSVRSSIWDVDMNGGFDWDGSVDSVIQNLPPSTKHQPMRTQIIDSVKYFGYSSELQSMVAYYIPEVSVVCYSDIDTISVVRNPIFNTAFSDSGIVALGSSVLGVVAGSFFDPLNDDIIWNWNDGSPSYYGDSNYHFLNDLQMYDIQVSVVDSFGCVTTENYINQFFVEGTLTISEESIMDDFVKLYPVPVTDYLTVETDFNVEEIRIVNALGKSVYYASDKSKIDCTDFAPGQYVVLIKINGELVNRKIIKQ